MSTTIIIPKFGKSETLPNWVERSMRQGCFLQQYLQREKAATDYRMAHNAAQYANYERPKGSEFELMGVMDMRTFLRWNETAPEILSEKKEYQKLSKDNPAMTPWK